MFGTNTIHTPLKKDITNDNFRKSQINYFKLFFQFISLLVIECIHFLGIIVFERLRSFYLKKEKKFKNTSLSVP